MKFGIICDYRESFRNYSETSKELYNDHANRKNIQEIIASIRSLGYECEYFGGVTIKIPTIEELESIVYALVLYQYVDIDKIPFEKAIKIITDSTENVKSVKLAYVQIKEILSNYSLTERAKEW